ncbi:hypothetical protein D3C87_1272660 [compost metagenome]
MKINTVLVLCLILAGCSHGGSTKRAPEVVASCFSDGDNQELFCKTQRINEESKVVTTRCIGTANKIAVAALRGKCVEKICIEGSQTECTTRGEFAVLQQYAELVKGRLFAEDESAPATSAPEKKSGKSKKSKSKKVAALKAAAAEIDTDPGVRLPPEPEKEEPVTAPAPLVKAAPAAPAEPPPMNVVLRPANSNGKSRVPANTKAPPDGFKRVCVAKADTAAPAILRGKCAVRSCTAGRCSYQGRKEMFDWAAR